MQLFAIVVYRLVGVFSILMLSACAHAYDRDERIGSDAILDKYLRLSNCERIDFADSLFRGYYNGQFFHGLDSLALPYVPNGTALAILGDLESRSGEYKVQSVGGDIVWTITDSILFRDDVRYLKSNLDCE